MRYEVEMQLPVAAEVAWSTLAAVGSWPSWTPTVQRVEPAPERLLVGTAVTVWQPGRRPVGYVVDLIEEGRRFRWGSRGGGVAQSADHVVLPAGSRTCAVRLSFAMTGPVGSLLGRLGRAKIREMVDAEAAALAAHLTPAGA